jgi:hypothetical protein
VLAILFNNLKVRGGITPGIRTEQRGVVGRLGHGRVARVIGQVGIIIALVLVGFMTLIRLLIVLYG